HVGRVHVVLDRDDGVHRLDDPEVQHRAHLHRDVVARDHVLRGHVHRHRAEVDAAHDLDEGDHDDEPGTPYADRATEPEDHPALVLLQHLEAAQDDEQHDDAEHRDRGNDHGFVLLSSCAGATSSVRPSMPMTRTGAPTGIRSRDRARQSSPWRNTVPAGASSLRASPVAPMSPSRPVAGLRRSARATRNARTSMIVPTAAAALAIRRRSIAIPVSPASNRKSEPSTNATRPPTPTIPKLGRKSSATSIATPSTSSASPAMLIGRIWNEASAIRRQMPPTIPGSSTPGCDSSR